MPYLLIRHTVQDFDSWKQAYDHHAAKRAGAGLTEVQLLRSVADANDVVLLLQAEDLDTARAFTRSEDLKQVMHDAGVIGTPELLELEHAQRTKPATQ